jgi:hypothetical protein
MNLRWEKQIDDMVSTHESSIEIALQEYERAITDEKEAREALSNEKDEIQHEFDSAITGYEFDADFEIEELKEKFHSRLKVEKNQKLKFRGEYMVMKKKYQSDKKAIELQSTGKVGKIMMQPFFVVCV